ncbi:MAG: hypothetical protein H0U53_05680 [Actinobacteria bacterium]|nr:hypothetical protein [Actinomycetota bacterium]
MSLRYALPGDPDTPFSEAVGVVLKVDQGRGDAEGGPGAPCVHILTRRGDTKLVPLEDIEAGKVWPT